MAGEEFAIGCEITSPELKEDNFIWTTGVLTRLNSVPEIDRLSGADVPTIVLGAIFPRRVGSDVVGHMNDLIANSFFSLRAK